MSSVRRQRVASNRTAPAGSVPVRLYVRRRRKRLAHASFTFLFLVALVLFSSGLSYRETFLIGSIRVEGAGEIPKEEVVAAAKEILEDDGFNFFARKNILLYPKGKIVKKITTDFPRAREVSAGIEDIFGGVLVIKVSERHAEALWCAEEECFLMDDGGFIFARSSNQENGGSLVRFEGALAGAKAIGSTYLPTEFARVKDLLELLERMSPKSFNVVSASDFEIEFENGMYVLASFSQDNGAIDANLQTALASDDLRGREDIEYVDLRFGNRAYFKFKNGGI